MLHPAQFRFRLSSHARTVPRTARSPFPRLGRILFVPLIATPLLGGCAGPSLSLLSPDAGAGNAAGGPALEGTALAQPSASPDHPSSQAASSGSRTLAEARSLRRAGDKRKAYDLIEGAIASAQAPDRGLLLEGGLLALEVGAPDRAEHLLKKAQDPAQPDWRVLSGLGVAASAQGRHAEARKHFTAALALKPGQPSILNNLAMSHVLERKPGEGEKVLREASKAAPASARIKQNLALTQSLKERGEETDAAPAAERAPAPPAPRKTAGSASETRSASAPSSWQTTSAAPTAASPPQPPSESPRKPAPERLARTETVVESN